LKLVLAFAAPVLAIAAAPAVDWTKRVTQTAQGAFVLGNPAAKTRLVEYVSYTCDHCAHFSNESSAALKSRYVANGGAAVEVRHAVRDPIDLAATLLARCTGPSRFFAAHEKLFATQEQWFGAGVRYAQANQDGLEKAPGPERVKMLAKAAGLGPLVGLNDQQVNACLSNPAHQKPVMAMTKEAWGTRKIPGTPHFLVNGQSADNVTSWAALEPRLSAK
jgi:protein-disulfide isomerase